MPSEFHTSRKPQENMAPKRSIEQKAECEQSKKTKFDSNISGEGNPSSSTPTEGSDMMNVSGNQTESSTDEDYIVEEPETEESGYQTETATETESFDNMIVYQTETATETESFDKMIESGDNSKSGNQTEGSDKMSVSGEESKPGDSSGESEKENILIEKHLTRLDVEDNLFFCFDLVSKCFPPPPAGRIPNAQLLLSAETVDDNDRFVEKHWDMTLTYSCADSEFMISTGWEKFVSDNVLEARDFIQFYLPDPRTHDKHYDIEVVRSQELDADGNINELDLKENFLFELQLKPQDILSERLVLCTGHVRILLPEINLTLELRFTDSQKKDWCMETKFDYERDGYLVTNGWKEFLNERNLDSTHKIKLCKPALPLRKYHFLISHEKTENDGGFGTDPFQSGDDDGGSSSNVGSN